VSKYDALRDHLRGAMGEVECSLDELSRIVPGGLPKSAFTWAAWWGNNDPAHTQSRSWREAGYTAHPDLAQRKVRFVPCSVRLPHRP
jgi:hypothetical protein